MCQSNVNQIIRLNAFSGAKWYNHATYIAFLYFELFTNYEDDIFKVISNFHIQLEIGGSKLAELFTNFWGNFWKVYLVVDYAMKKILYKTLLIVTKKHKQTVGSLLTNIWWSSWSNKFEDMWYIRMKEKTKYVWELS